MAHAVAYRAVPELCRAQHFEVKPPAPAAFDFPALVVLLQHAIPSGQEDGRDLYISKRYVHYVCLSLFAIIVGASGMCSFSGTDSAA